MSRALERPSTAAVVRILGTPFVEREGAPLGLPSKALALLAMLVLESGPVSKDLLADRLWPDSAQARANLRKAIKAVRDALGADALAVSSRTVALGPGIGADVEVFRRALDGFDGHHPDLDVACDACLTALSAADELWRGELLDGQTLEDSPVFDEWRAPHVEHLRDARSRLLAALVRAHVDRRDWVAADRVASRALAHAPLDEAAWRARMRVLAWSGRRAEAVALYDRVAHTIGAELGVEPSERSTALRDAIRDDTLAPPPSPSPASSPSPSPSPRTDAGGPLRTGPHAAPDVPTGREQAGGAQDAVAVGSRAGPDPAGGVERSAAPPPAGLARMLAVVRAGGDPAELPEALLGQVARHEPAGLTAYLLARAARWLAPPHSLALRFVPLEFLLASRGRPAPERAPRRWSDLRTALGELDAEVVVLLGRPGAGKSTLLRRLELDLALIAASGEPAPVPLLAPLARFSPVTNASEPSPRSWLERVWRRRSNHLPPLHETAHDRGVLVLLDGFDEMPDGRGGARAWRDFVRSELPDLPGLRIVISCRELDFDLPSPDPERPWPRLLAQPLSQPAMRAFVDAHVGEGARERFWRWLETSNASSLYRTPYLLKLLTAHAVDGEPPSDVAALLTSFVRAALVREVERDHPALAPEGVLHERDVRQLIHDRWSDAYALPSRGLLVPGLEMLADALLRGRIETDGPLLEADTGSVARFDRASAKAVIGDDAPSVIAAALGLGLLGEDVATDRLHFDHRLMLDYFAARRMAEGFELPGRPVAWRAADLDAETELVVAALEAHEPLPPLPHTGFEEALSMAALMSGDPGAAIAGLADFDLPLAGRAASAGPERFGPHVVGLLRERLVERATSQAADIRSRIAAGEALGELGDPRLTRVGDGRDECLVPPMCRLPAGEHRIGSAGGAADEAPEHSVALPAFEIAVFEVTNAEWARFMAAGGYEEPRYWDTPDATAWREGRGTDEGPRASALEWTERFRADPERLDELFESGHMSAEWHAIFRQRIAMSVDELAAHLAEMYPGGRLTQPRYWDDPRFSNPSQPVVGISWFEARAYAAWLAERTGRRFRLPSEVEWEAACRWRDGDGGAPQAGTGSEARTESVAAIESETATGSFVVNTSESHVWRPTPIGVFGATAGTGMESHTDRSGGQIRKPVPAQARAPTQTPTFADMLGNIWEWTSSLYGREPGAPDFPYPYSAGDGREDPAAPADVRRVARGGAWDSPRAVATPSVRDAVRPGGRDQAYGMRLACDPQ